jgi:hypothetical protein
MHDVREIDFLREHAIEVPAFKRKEWRSARLTEDDWYRTPKGIMLRPSGQQRILVADVVEEVAPLAVQEFHTLRVIGPAHNPKVVLCVHPETNLKVPVLCGKWTRRFRDKKWLRAQRVRNENGEEAWRHEKLAI